MLSKDTIANAEKGISVSASSWEDIDAALSAGEAERPDLLRQTQAVQDPPSPSEGGGHVTGSAQARVFTIDGSLFDDLSTLVHQLATTISEIEGRNSIQQVGTAGSGKTAHGKDARAGGKQRPA